APTQFAHRGRARRTGSSGRGCDGQTPDHTRPTIVYSALTRTWLSGKLNDVGGVLILSSSWAPHHVIGNAGQGNARGPLWREGQGRADRREDHSADANRAQAESDCGAYLPEPRRLCRSDGPW